MLPSHTLILLLALTVPALAQEGGKSVPDPRPPDFAHHALVQRKVGFYAVFPPPGYDDPANAEMRYPVCLILHGHGSTEMGHGRLADTFGREGVIYVAPRAPHPLMEMFIGEGKPGWTAWPNYPEEWGDRESDSFPKDELEGIDPVKLYVDWIADCLADARKRYRTDGRKAVVVGHSQGAAFAHRFALARPDLVRAYFAYAGYYSDTLEGDATAKTLTENGIYPVIVHCEGDEMVEVEETRKFAAYLKEHGVEHEALVLPGGSHSFNSKVNRRGLAFVSRRCRGEEPPPMKGEVVVSGVVADSQAAALGVSKGDVILTYAGRKLTCLDDLLAAKKQVEEGVETTMTIRRGEATIELAVKGGQLGVMLTDR